MRGSRVAAPRPAVVAMLAGVVVAAGGAPSSAQLPIEPVKESGQSVTGAFEGWYSNPDGTFTLLVGYFNRNSKQVLDIPVGPNNRIEPGGPDMGQPTHFLPRRQWGVFTIVVPKDLGKNRLTWTLVANGQTTAIPMHIDPLWVVEPFKDVGIGNTPPTLRLAQGGPGLQGPPRGVAASLTATVGKPLPLPAWVADDGIKAPEAANRPGPAIAVSWSEFRGPADVMFDPTAPKVDEKTGAATTSATFTAPGDYTLRVQVNDSTGDGGGGFQCCWTNAHVKVTVH
jgi:hypothetical protein